MARLGILHSRPTTSLSRLYDHELEPNPSSEEIGERMIGISEEIQRKYCCFFL